MKQIMKLNARLDHSTYFCAGTGVSPISNSTFYLDPERLPEEIVQTIADFENKENWVIREIGLVGVTVSISVEGEQPCRSAKLFLPHTCILGIKGAA